MRADGVTPGRIWPSLLTLWLQWEAPLPQAHQQPPAQHDPSPRAAGPADGLTASWLYRAGWHISWLLCPPSSLTVWADWPRDLCMQDKFHQKGLSRLRFSLKQTEEKQQLPMPNCLRRTISKQGPYILLRQGTSQVMNVGLPWPFQETLTLTDYRQINTQQ